MSIIPKGQEPANIKKRLDILFPKLDAAYPDRVIVSLQKDHKKWAETVTELYRALGYPDGASFLEAYGYSYAKKDSGRPRTTDPNDIIRALQAKYPSGSPFSSADELFEANPDYLPKLKTIKNLSSETFGMSLGKYLLSIGLIKSKRQESKSIREESFYLCTVAPIAGFRGMYFLSETKTIHIGDYVEVSMWNNLSSYGVVTDTITCTEQTAPCDIKKLDIINRKVGIRLFESNYLRNILSINAADKVQLLQKAVFHDVSIRRAPNLSENNITVKWACCRGLVIEILRVLDYLVEHEKQVYKYSDIMLITDTIAKLHIYGSDVYDVLTRFPSLKVAMFAIDRKKETVSMWYSRSGSNYVTDQDEFGAYDNKNDWTLKHAPTESEFSIPHGKYSFKFEDDWNQVNYICDAIAGYRVQVKEMSK